MRILVLYEEVPGPFEKFSYIHKQNIETLETILRFIQTLIN